MLPNLFFPHSPLLPTWTLPLCKLPLNLTFPKPVPSAPAPFCSFGLRWRVSSVTYVLQMLKTYPFFSGSLISGRGQAASFPAQPAPPPLGSEQVGHGCWFSRQSREVCGSLHKGFPTTLCTPIGDPSLNHFLNLASKKTIWVGGTKMLLKGKGYKNKPKDRMIYYPFQSCQKLHDAFSPPPLPAHCWVGRQEHFIDVL